MTTLHASPGPCLLPLLLTLPAGAIAGIPADSRSGHPCLHADLEAFGPRLPADGELRHAVSRPPGRVVVEADGASLPVLEAALPALRRGGSAVVIHSGDRGLLARLADLVLQGDIPGPGWLWAESYRAMRCLELRVEGADSAEATWIRVPLGGAGAAEAVLASVRAEGIRVRESRIAYGCPPAR